MPTLVLYGTVTVSPKKHSATSFLIADNDVQIFGQIWILPFVRCCHFMILSSTVTVSTINLRSSFNGNLHSPHTGINTCYHCPNHKSKSTAVGCREHVIPVCTSYCHFSENNHIACPPVYFDCFLSPWASFVQALWNVFERGFVFCVHQFVVDMFVGPCFSWFCKNVCFIRKKWLYMGAS